jgi:hypothetical protein
VKTSKMLLCVPVVRVDVSEEIITSIMRATRTTACNNVLQS